MNMIFLEIRDRVDRQDAHINEMQQGTSTQVPRPWRPNPQPPIPNNFDEEADFDNDVASNASTEGNRGAGYHRPRHVARGHWALDVLDRNTGSIKLFIPSFQGKNDPSTYIE